SLNEEHISDAAWLEMEKTILAEREAMWFDTLDRNDSELVVGVFVQTDRVSHMFYRGLDPEHPRHEDTLPEHRDSIEWIYTEADRILGETMQRLGPDDELMVISDHGFSPFRKAVHLNRWLVDNGYLVLDDDESESDVVFASVDWSRSQAYALGLNGLFINRAGREAQGSVAPADVAAIKREISERLENWADEASGEAVVRRVFDGLEIYPGAEDNDEAPDLVVGYQRGYRASWQTTLGAVPGALMEPNAQKWSGDHCIDPALVPGVLFSTFKPERDAISIQDVWSLAQDRIQ
ncbi:MAG: alkaline phosphatase family protein, partial [Wenzhouxiangellaceae bacterium]|nr:alkaline phosphatase family protein [Wenzhouxiangellaceae bacterium]